jgi:hypothetical protein
VELTVNLVARLDEARAFGWNGEIQALNASLTAAKAKLADMDRAAQPSTTILGLPSKRSMQARGAT